MARILLLYVTAHSGHHRASQAVEHAIQMRDPTAEVLSVDGFQYFNPILAGIVDRTYMSVIRTAPEIWDYLYDNPKVAERSQAFLRFLHRYDSPKLRALLEEFRPTAIACTQAFPCGVAADYKKAAGIATPLYGILTDFIPHTYWVHEAVDGYLVGADVAREWLVRSGVPAEKVRLTGIPIDPVFAEERDGVGVCRELALDPREPVVLVMGGGQGFGPIEQMVRGLTALPQSFQLVVVAGVNAKLQQRLARMASRVARRLVVLGHVSFVHDLMGIATLIVTKAGGLTTSEALAKHLPMIVVDPIPGQEVKNTQFLLSQRAAVQAPRWEQVPELVTQLLTDPERLASLRRAAGALGRPQASLEIARLLLRHSDVMPGASSSDRHGQRCTSPIRWPPHVERDSPPTSS